MKKILGLDPGVASIGWALVNEAENENEESSIIRLGTRAVPIDANEKQNYSSGKDIGVNKNRTLKRGTRRNLDRYQQRRENIKHLFLEAGIIKDSTIFSEEGKGTTFKTRRDRALAVTQEIDLESLARVVLQINKKRGYKSSRKNKEANVDSLGVDAVATAVLLQRENITPGQYANRLIEGSLDYKSLPVFFRHDLLKEFNIIYERQAEYHAELTEELKNLLMRKNKRDSEQLFIARFGLPEFAKRNPKDSIVLRAKAVSCACTFEEVAYILADLRGKMSSSSSRLADITDNSKELAISGRTVGQYQYDLLLEDSNRSIVGQTFYRQDYVDEFDRIWETQSKYHAELTPELGAKLRYIIKEQRPLKSQKSQIALCEFEKRQVEVEKNGKKVMMWTGLKVCPISSPMFQEFRMWQRLNDVVIIDAEENVTPLTMEERMILASRLESTARLSAKDVLRLLLGNKAKGYRLNFEELIGNETSAELLKAYRKIAELTGHGLSANSSLHDIEEIFDAMGFPTGYLHYHPELERKKYKQQPYYRLWHLLYSFDGDSSTTGNEKLVEHIADITGLPRDYAEILAQVSFPDGYGSLSTKALRPILRYLKEGHSYDMACSLAGYNHSAHSLTREQKAERPLKDALELIPRNQLRSPIVEKILNQMVGLVNSIIEQYGRPDEIRLELARDLKQSKQERQQASAQISAQRKKNENIIQEICQNWPQITHPTKREIQKYRLWKELEPLGYRALYSGREITKELLFSGDVDFEHIIPKSRFFNDSLTNKTLEFHSVNSAEKGAKTAYDYMSGLGEEALQAYRKNVEILFKGKAISLGKRRMLLMEEKDIPEDFLNRDLALTQYITRASVELLEQVVREVNVTTGSVTDRLRQDWGLIDVMKDLNYERYDKVGRTYSYTTHDGRTIRAIKDWTKRDDHRHHAMDALVVAFTRKAYIQYLNNVNAQSNANSAEWGIRQKYMENHKETGLRFRTPIMPMESFKAQAMEKLEEIITSFRPSRISPVTINVNKYRYRNGKSTKQQITLTPRGQLTEELHTYGYRRVLRDGAEHTIFVHREQLNEKIDVKKVVDPVMKTLLEKRLERYGGSAKNAFSQAALESDPVIWNKAIVKKVTVEVSAGNLVPIRKKFDHNGQPVLDKDGNHEPADFVKTGNNHRLDIYRDAKGNYYGKVVTFLDAVKQSTSQLPPASDTEQPVLSLMKGDYVVFEGDGPIQKRLFRLQKFNLGSSPKFIFRHIWDSTLYEGADLKGITNYRFSKLDFAGKIKKVNVDRLGNIIE